MLQMAAASWAGCTVPQRDVGPHPPPGAGVSLTGPTSVLPGQTARWQVTAPDLPAWRRVFLAWSTAQGTGTCPFQPLTGGQPCMDLAHPSRLLSVAWSLPTATGGRAIFDLSVPAASPLDEVVLQAFVLDGTSSSTSNTLVVEIRPPALGGDTDSATLDSADTDLTADSDADTDAHTDADTGPTAVSCDYQDHYAETYC